MSVFCFTANCKCQRKSCDPKYQTQTKEYFTHIRFSGRPNTNKYTGGQMKGDTKKTTQEQLDFVAEQLAAKVKRAEVELAAARAAAEANKAAEAKKKAGEETKAGEELTRAEKIV